MRELPGYYPAFLNINGRRCVVIGGGLVAQRKVRMLLECGATVVVISPDYCAGLDQMVENGEIQAIRRHYQAGDLRGAKVVIAATDDKNINREIVREARNEAVLANVVDDAELSDFIVPAYLRRGDVTIAVSTAGTSPALARKIKARLEKEFGEEYAALVRLIGEVRRQIRQQGVEVDGDTWQEAIDLDWLIELLRAGNSDKAKSVLLDNLMARQK